MNQPPTVQRAIMNRHHQVRRSSSNIAPKLEPGAAPMSHAHPSIHTIASPQTRPTPPSHHSSPTSNSPSFQTQGVMTPPASDSQTQIQRAAQPLKPHMHHGLPMPTTTGGLGPGIISAIKGQGSSEPGSMGGVPAAYYPTTFQNHFRQLGKLTPSYPFSFERAMFVLD
jgi:hypothetical protein